MAQTLVIELKLPGDLDNLRFPAGLNQRLQHLLDKQDQGQPLSLSERQEAEGLVEVAELLTILRSKAEIAAKGINAKP